MILFSSGLPLQPLYLGYKLVNGLKQGVFRGSEELLLLLLVWRLVSGTAVFGVLKVRPVDLHFGENFVQSCPFVLGSAFELPIDLWIVCIATKGKNSIV